MVEGQDLPCGTLYCTCNDDSFFSGGVLALWMGTINRRCLPWWIWYSQGYNKET